MKNATGPNTPGKGGSHYLADFDLDGITARRREAAKGLGWTRRTRS